MKINRDFAWAETPQEAIALQQVLKNKVITTDQIAPVKIVAGIDVGFRDEGKTTRAAVAVLSFPDLQLVDQAIAHRPTSFPYIPGLLSFREVPAVLDALEQLEVTPDLLLCDGQGIAHPRRLGIACHIGILTDLPAIGVAKSLLVGKHGDLPDPKGAWVPLLDRGETIGAVVRTRTGTKPLCISPGHRVSLETAIEYVFRCTTKYRLPETTRFAHKLASDVPSGAKLVMPTAQSSAAHQLNLLADVPED